MAQFKSSAQEGSFSGNQLIVPDEVTKIQKEGERRLRGMSTAQAHLQKNQQLFLAAQQQAQAIQQDDRERAEKINSSNTSAQKRSAVDNWQRVLDQEEAKNKNKVDTFKTLSAFSKTAFDITAGIMKQNKDNQLKAIADIAFRHNYSYKDLLNAKSVNTAISLADWQESQMVKDYLKQGKSQEFINTMHQHLIKGGGYMNYIDNANVLRVTAEAHAQEYVKITADPSLSPDEKRQKLEVVSAQQRGELTVNGQIAGEQIRNQAYYPTIRQALARADVRINEQTRENIVEVVKARQTANLLNVAYASGEFNADAVVKQIAARPTAGGFTEMAKFFVERGLPEEHLNSLKTAVFFKNGMAESIQDGNYTDALAILNKGIEKEGKKRQERFQLDIQAKNIKATMTLNQAVQGYADNDGLLTEVELLKAFQAADEAFGGPGRDTSNDAYYRRQTVDKNLIPVMDEFLQQKKLDGSLSVAELDRIGPPDDLYNSYFSFAQRFDNARNSNPYKELEGTLRERVIGALANVKNLSSKFSDAGPKSDQMKWLVNKFVQQGKQDYIKGSIVGNLSSAELTADVGNRAVEAARLYAESTKNYEPSSLDAKRKVGPNSSFKEYRQMIEASSDETITSYAVSATIQNWKDAKTDRNKLRKPETWVDVLGEEVLITGSKNLETKGSSLVLETIAQDTNLTVYEVQQQLVEAKIIEPVDMIPTYAQLANNWSKDQRYAFTSNLSSNQQKLRTLEAQIKGLDTSYSYQVRPSMQQPAEPLNGTIQEKGNQAITYMTQDLGLSDFHAYGLLANAIRESSLQTTNPGDNGTSDGWFQWHAGRLSRAKAVLGDRWNDWRAQIQYALQEEGEPGQEYLQQNFSSRQEAADWWMKYWERPAHPERDSKRHSEILGDF